MVADARPGDVVGMRASPVFSESLRGAAVDVLGENGAWLLLSIVHYGWRATFDAAATVASSDPPPFVEGEGRPGPVDEEFHICQALEVQGALFQAAELFATLLRACVRHHRGDQPFMQSYTDNVPVSQLLADCSGFAVGDLGAVLGLPAARGDLDALTRAGFKPPLDADLVATANDLPDQLMASIDQMAQLTSAPAAPAGVEIKPQSLREIDNSFRHGHRVLYWSTVPGDRAFRTLNPKGHVPGTRVVDLFLPKGGDESVSFGTVDCSDAAITENLRSTRNVCVWIGQVSRGFLGAITGGGASMTLVATRLALGIGLLDENLTTDGDD
ncbi:MAG: hypothetical protein GY788_19640 [bacterium]|nr:hypothetical protein [bacterium]